MKTYSLGDREDLEPPMFTDIKEVESFIKSNWKRLFYRSRQYRLDPDSITNVKVEILRIEPNKLDFLLILEIKTGNKIKPFHFYESVLIKKEAGQDEVVLGKITIKNTQKFVVDAFSNSTFVEGLINDWNDGKQIGKLIFLGKTIKDFRNSKVQDIQCLYTSSPSTNYTYILHLTNKTIKKQIRMFIKRFTPRNPIDRGNREYEILMGLRDLKIIPNAYGALAAETPDYPIEKPLILVIFSEFLENTEEVGAKIWRMMYNFSHDMNRKRKTDVIRLVRECIHEIVAPFHAVSFQKWHTKDKIAVEGSQCYEEFFSELNDNLHILIQHRLISKKEGSCCLNTFSQLWKTLLIHIPLTEIHHDLMWKQILVDNSNQYYLLDLDEHIPGHAAKDLADLMAANRFIAEKLEYSLDKQKKDSIRKLAEEINESIISSYKEKLGGSDNSPWLKSLESACKGYLTFRHLHDAAYFAPISATDPDHRHSTEFSVKLFKNSFSDLLNTVQKLKEL